MGERARLQRKRNRGREEHAALATVAGLTDRAGRTAEGGPSGVLDAVVAETTRAATTPNAVLDSAAGAELVHGTIAHVVGRALEESPRGHRLTDFDVFPRAEDADGASDAEMPTTVERFRHTDDSGVASRATDNVIGTEGTDEQPSEQETEPAEADPLGALEATAKPTAMQRGKSGAAPATPPVSAGGETSSDDATGTESASKAPSPSARAAEPADALVDAVGSASTIEQDVEAPEEREQSLEERPDADELEGTESIDAGAIEARVETGNAGVGVEVEDVAADSGVEAVAPQGEGAGADGAGEAGDAEAVVGAAAKTAGGRGAGGKGKGGVARGAKGGGGKGAGGGKAAGGGKGAGGGKAAGGAKVAGSAKGTGGGKGGGEGKAGGGGGGGGPARASGGVTAAAAAAAPAGPADLPALATASVALIDEELVEHQRWAGARGAVGEAGSLERAAFVVDTAGGAALSGLASGAAMGLGIGLAVRATSFIPGLGGAIGGVMALHGLSQKFEHWDETAATIGRFGEGNSTYETLANSIAAVGEIVDIVSQVLNVINGVVGVLTLICFGITAAGAIATIATLGAAAPVLAAAAEMSLVLEEIELGITAATQALDVINAAVLQPAVLLFRAMHTFTSQADPREVEASGGQIAQAAAAWGGTLGAKAGGALAEVGSGGGAHSEEESSATQRVASDTEAHAAPPPAGGGGGAGAAGPEGPTVHFEGPTGGAAVDAHAPTNLDIPAAHADTVPMAAPGGGTVDVNAPTNLDIPAAHAQTNLDIPAAHADTIPMAAPQPGVSPMATTGEVPVPGVSPMATTGEVPVPGVSPMATTGEMPTPGVSPMAHSVDTPAVGAGPQGAEPPIASAVDPLGRTGVDPLGQTAPAAAPGPAGGTPNEPVPGGALQPPPDAGLGGVKGWPPHDPYPGNDAPMGDRLAWGLRQYEPGGQWHSDPLPPPTPPAPAPEPAPWVGPPRNPVVEMTPVNPADVYPGAPQPPGFRAGPVGSLGATEMPTSGSAPAAPALPGQRNPVMEMTPVNPADVYPGAPQPPGFQAGPVGSLDLPPATPLPMNVDVPAAHAPTNLDIPAAHAPTNLDIPAAHAPTNLDIPAAHAPTNLDIPAAHAATQPVDVVPAGPATLPGLGPESLGPATLPGLGPSPAAGPAPAGVDVQPVQTGQTLPGIGPEPVTAAASHGDGGGGGGGGAPPQGGGPGGGGGSHEVTPEDIQAGRNQRLRDQTQPLLSRIAHEEVRESVQGGIYNQRTIDIENAAGGRDQTIAISEGASMGSTGVDISHIDALAADPTRAAHPENYEPLEHGEHIWGWHGGNTAADTSEGARDPEYQQRGFQSVPDEETGGPLPAGDEPNEPMSPREINEAIDRESVQQHRDTEAAIDSIEETGARPIVDETLDEAPSSYVREPEVDSDAEDAARAALDEELLRDYGGTEGGPELRAAIEADRARRGGAPPSSGGGSAPPEGGPAPAGPAGPNGPPSPAGGDTTASSEMVTSADGASLAGAIDVPTSSSGASAAREPSVIVNEEALGLPPGSVVTTEPTAPRAAPAGPQTDVDWSQMRVVYDRDPAGNITGSRLVYDHNGKTYPVEFNPQVGSFDPSAPPGPGPFAGTVGMPNYRHAPTTLADGTVVQHPPEFKPEAYITTTPAEGAFGVRVGPGGAWMDHTFPTRAEAEAYAQTVAHGDAAAGTPPSTEADIRDRSALPVGWPPNAAGEGWGGNPVDAINVHPLPPNMPQIFSQVAPQPEGDPRAGYGRVYPGGGPQVQIPKGVVHPGSAPVATEPIQRSGFPPPHAGPFRPFPGGPAGSGPLPSRSPTLPGIGAIPRPGSLGSVARVASATASANAVPSGNAPGPAGGGGGGPVGAALASDSVVAAVGPSAHTIEQQREGTVPRTGTPGQAASPAEPSTTDQVGQLFLPQVFGPEGAQPTHEQRVAAHNAHFSGDNQAPEGVERVNPAYPEPPGTPQQLAQIQTEITNLLAARAQTERAEQRMAGQEAKHRAGEAPIQQAIDDTAAGTAASRAHEQSVARHATANQEQQQRQQQGGGLVAGYPSRAAGLAALTVPLGVFEGFTRYASILPGDAGDAMARMNADARRMEDAFGQMAATMLTQDQAQPTHQAELQGDQQRLQTTGTQASDSSSQLVEASQGATQLQRANQEKLRDATQAKEEAVQQKVELGDAAAQKEEQATTLSTQLESWAPSHKHARDEAVHETEERLQQEGYVVVQKSGS